MVKIFLMAMLMACLPSASLCGERSSALSPRSRHQLTALSRHGNDASVQCFIKVDDADAVGALERKGVNVQHVFGNVLTAEVPVAVLNDVCSIAKVRQVQLAQKMSLCNDVARQASFINEAQAMSAGSAGTFSGKGVIVGMVDVGIDFNHVSFRDAEGNSRVKRVYLPAKTGGKAPEIDGKELPGSSYETSEAISQLTTDCVNQSHGTHTTTTAAGSYKGNGYYGVATGSDLVLCAMPEEELTDVNIANSVAYIFDYADKVGLPAVVNMSLSSSAGAHDGTSMLSQAFASKAGKGHLMVLSIGNDGRFNTKISKQFAAETDTLRTIFEYKYSLKALNTTFDMWSSNEKPFKVRLVAFDSKVGQIYSSDFYTASTNDADSLTIDVGKIEALKDIYSGTVSLTSGIGDNGKMEVFSDINLDIVSNEGNASRYYFGVNVWAEPGTTVSGWTDSRAQMVSFGIDGYVYGTTDGNISDLATGEGVISVGAYCPRSKIETVGGTVNYNDITVDDIMVYSSYGKDMNGVSQPMITAPGYPIVSALNRCDTTLVDGDMVLISTIDGDKYCWGAEGGTSMSAPVVSGTLALWLEAKADLTCSEVKQVLVNTSTRDAYVEAKPERWGYGKINALKGLQYLTGSGISNAGAEKMWSLSAQGGGFVLNAPCDGAAKIEAYDMAGRMVMHAAGSVNGGYGMFKPMQMPTRGVYLMKVSVGNAHHTFKIIV